MSTTAVPAAPQRGIAAAVRNSVSIRRLEFLPVAITIALVPALAVARDFAELWSFPVLLAYIGIQFGAHMGDMVNCLSDRDLDATYKPRLSNAVYGLGTRNVTVQIVATSIFLFGVGTYFVWSTGHWDIVALYVALVVLVTQYSLPPFHAKNRGVWQIVTLWAMIYVLPMIFMVRSFHGDRLTWTVLLLILSFGTVQVGVILLNTAEDYPEDRAFGLRTSIVALGITASMWLATAMVVAGGIGSVVAVLRLGAPVCSTAPLVLAVLVEAGQLARVALAVRGQDVDTAMARLRPPARLMPVYLMLTAWATVFAAVIAVAQR